MTPLAGPIVTVAQMRAAEVASGVALDVLMERAGAAVADAAWRLSGGAPILVLCGPGNNGGEGYVAARLLAARGADVRVTATGVPTTDLSRGARKRWQGEVEALESPQAAPIIVDAVFGIGLSRRLDDVTVAALARLRHAARLTLAVDTPSGVGSDDGAHLGGVGADVTLALGAAKPAHLLMPAAQLCGRVVIADIGITVGSETEVLAQPALRPPTANDHKYTRGLVVIVQGAMPGAAALAASAAAWSGAGYVVLVGDEMRLPRAVVVRPHADLRAVLADPRVGAVVIGPGLGRGREAIVEQVLASAHPVVVDGDALQLGLPTREAPMILTPHAGEFARMFGDQAGSKLDRTRAAAAACGATVVHKGADTVIASPDGRATIGTSASPWLATAGTGDALAGVAGAMLARGLGPHDAAAAAVWLHGEAARRAGAALIADDLLGHLPAAVARATTR